MSGVDDVTNVEKLAASPRVRLEWRRRAAAEYRSSALAAQVVHWSIQVGMPEELVHTGLRIVRD